jgi:uncharacterized protein
MAMQQDYTGDRPAPLQLANDTIVNVAHLMKADVGEKRRVTLDLDWFALDEDLAAKDVHADLRMMRISRGILVSGHVCGTALVECVRCLEIYEQPFEADFDEEYRPTIDVRSGLLVEQPPAEEELGTIDEAHELDLGEPLRQVAILALPIKPVCREDCPGVADADLGDVEEGDQRLGVLGRLLEPDDDTTNN